MIGAASASSVDLAGVGNLGPVAVDEGAVFFDGLNDGARIAQLRHLVRELFLGDLDGGLVDGNLFVAFDGEVGQIFEDRLDVQRLAVIDGQLGHLRLADGTDAQFADALVEALGQQAVDDFFADLSGKAAADHGLGHLAGAEAGKLGVLLVVAGHGAEGFRYLFRGNIQHQFAGAFRIQNRPMLMFVVVIVIVAFVAVAVLGCTRWGVVFRECLRCSTFCLPGATGAK